MGGQGDTGSRNRPPIPKCMDAQGPPVDGAVFA